jgi:hypothetical protein
LDIVELSIDVLRKNDWNPNHLDEADLKLMVGRFLEKKAVDKPPTVRMLGDSNYEILDGEQTVRAAKQAGFTTLPCIVVEVSDTEAIATTFVKNLHGVMNPVVVGRNILRMKQLAEQGGKSLSNGDVANLMNKTEGTIRNYLVYAEATAWCGKVEGYPTEKEVAKLSVKEVRALVEQMVAGGGGNLARQQPLPMTTEDGQTVADAMSDEEKATKAFDKALKVLKGLDLDQLRRIKNEVNRLIREANKGDKDGKGMEAEAA